MAEINGFGIDSQIKARANELLKSKEKQNLAKDDLEILWQYTKAEENIQLPADLTDEQVLEMMDTLDNENNTAKISYRLFMNWLKDKIGGSSAETPSTPPSVEPSTPEVSTPEVSVPETPSQPEVEEPTVETPEVEEPTVETPEVEEPEVSTPEPPTSVITPSPVVPNQPAATELTYVRLMPNGSTTIEVNGQSYTIKNSSSTINNIAYRFDGTSVVVEGNNVSVMSNQDKNTADNIKVLGNNNVVDLGEGDDIVEIEGECNMIYGGDGNDFIKMRGNYNSADMSLGNDTVWMAGNKNIAHGQGGEDKFFAIGAGNTFYGQDGTDASYYNETEGVGNEFEIGKGHEFRVENKITDAKDFEDWAKRNEPDGPPYTQLPEALEGHEVRAYDDNTYTDKYEEEPLYYTEYRDIAYRELDAKTSYNNITGEGNVATFKDDGTENQNITFNPDGSVVVKQGNETININAAELKYYDKDGNIVANPGNMQAILEKLATGTLSVGNANGAINPAKPEFDRPVIDLPVIENPCFVKVDDETGIISAQYSTYLTHTQCGGTMLRYTIHPDGTLVAVGNMTGGPMGGVSYTGTVDDADFYNVETGESIEKPESLVELANMLASGEILIRNMQRESIIEAEKSEYTETIDGNVTQRTYSDDNGNKTATTSYDSSLNTGKLQIGVENIVIAADGTIKHHTGMIGGGPNVHTLEPDNVEFFNVETGEAVNRPSSTQELLHLLATGEIDFKSKSVLPEATEGHIISKLNDEYYSDSYTANGVTYTDVKDLQYRNSYAQIIENPTSGETSMVKYNYAVTAEGNTMYTIDKDGNLNIKNLAFDNTYFTSEVRYADKAGTIVSNLSTQEILLGLATGQLVVVLNDGTS